MGLRPSWEWRWWNGGFVAFPSWQAFCDLCERDTVAGETDACKRCRDEIAAIAEQLQAATGIDFTPDLVRVIGRGPRPPRFRYGKPWHRHIPQHERKRYGLHA